MNSVSRWKIAFLVLASFVAGAVTGAFLIMGSAKDEIRRQRDPVRWFVNTPDRWRSEMKLTPDQDQKIRPILQEIDTELANRRAVDTRETEGILSRGEDRIAAILRPEQRPQLHQTFEQRRQRLRDWMGVKDQTVRPDAIESSPQSSPSSSPIALPVESPSGR
jgi:Spy/CpxP family protein refolding chaperone